MKRYLTALLSCFLLFNNVIVPTYAEGETPSEEEESSVIVEVEPESEQEDGIEEVPEEEQIEEPEAEEDKQEELEEAPYYVDKNNVLIIGEEGKEYEWPGDDLWLMYIRIVLEVLEF